MRKLQLVYCLEPAGSHGVWGLDDYHFLLFIFGSSQLIDHKYMKPKSIHNHDILDNFSNEFMYLSCIAFIKKVKELFAEHSPLLDDISAVPNWNKGFDDASVLMEYMQWQENCIQEGSHLTENRYEGRNLLD
ncbi:hypothetical protein Dsin_032591 [Dipteronia sinensis]|uniref:Serine/threonine-protein phosphatase 2A activator n=1 Tax=Dipteronia sinensis TaxID=43782 RepID=A0AAD9ZCV5_9ROSI|nr:hypothetical protein Dsin_032591 [Dipteronia sinensis]